MSKVGKIKFSKMERANLNQIMKKRPKYQKKTRLPEQKPDTFEHLSSDMEGMKFKTKRIEFYPEDIEKMKTMSDKEQIDYAIYLRQKKRYKVVSSDQKTD